MLLSSMVPVPPPFPVAMVSKVSILPVLAAAATIISLAMLSFANVPISGGVCISGIRMSVTIMVCLSLPMLLRLGRPVARHAIGARCGRMLRLQRVGLAVEDGLLLLLWIRTMPVVARAAVIGPRIAALCSVLPLRWLRTLVGMRLLLKSQRRLLLLLLRLPLMVAVRTASTVAPAGGTMVRHRLRMLARHGRR